MSKRPFDKELIKRSVVYNVKTLYRRNIEAATQQQIFHAVALATKDAIIKTIVVNRTGTCNAGDGNRSNWKTPTSSG